MRKELTPEEIDKLFEFTRTKYVEYYDVQLELVDHLATAIEATWEVDRDCPFEEALQKTYLGFGRDGFDKVRIEKAKMVRREATKICFKTLLTFFKLPYLLLTVLLFLVLAKAVLFLPEESFYLYYSFALLIIGATLRTYTIIHFRKARYKLQLLSMKGFSSISFEGQWLIPVFLNPLTPDSAVLASGMYSILTLLLVASFLTSWKMRQKAEELYPKAFV